MTERPRRKRRPGPLPVILATVATFLVLVVLLAAQLRSGHDPALGSGARVALVSGKHGASVVTRTSGGGGAQAVPGGKAASTHHPVTTRTSGGGEEHEGD